MIEVLPPLEKYKYDTWRILPVKCYIDNSVRLWSCIRNINNHIRVLTNYPLHDIFLNRDSSRWIGKWATELLEYIINFERCSTIKSQILADFVAKWTEPQSQVDIVQESSWLVYCDGAWGSTEAATAAILTSPYGIKLRYAARLQFTGKIDKCTDNIIEYEAILLGLWKLRAIGVQTCMLRTDSKVVSG
jgi:hypothetical protein